MNESYITKDELAALQKSSLSDRSTPFIIMGVSHTQFSIARHYGGVKYMGRHYFYVPPTDELVRDDVMKWLAKHRKNNKKQVKVNVVSQGKLF